LSTWVDEAAAIWSFCAVVTGEGTIDRTTRGTAIWHIGSRWSVEVPDGELREEATGEGAERANGGQFEGHIDSSTTNSRCGMQMADAKPKVICRTKFRVLWMKVVEERQRERRKRPLGDEKERETDSLTRLRLLLLQGAELENARCCAGLRHWRLFPPDNP
jgi:hypothetical protein